MNFHNTKCAKINIQCKYKKKKRNYRAANAQK